MLTSPLGPYPISRTNPLTCTSSPGRYIPRSSNTYQRTSSKGVLAAHPDVSHMYVARGRMAVSSPSRPTSRLAGMLGSWICASPSAPVVACTVPGSSCSCTPSSGVPSLSLVAHAVICVMSLVASSPMFVDCTQLCTT